MPATTRLNELAERKRLLILQAAMHRQIIEIERLRWQERLDATRERLHANRWWAAGAMVAAGWLSTRKLGGVLRWFPPAMTVWRIVRKMRTH